MGSVSEYFKGLGSGVASLVKGLQVTGSELVKKKITEYYPEDRNTYPWPKRFRAILRLVYDDQGRHKCIACGTCERVCPNGTISLDIDTVETWDGKKKKHLANYAYDLGSCTFCQLCVTNCPTAAIDFSNDFEQAVFTRDKLVKKLNYLPDVPEPEPTEAEKKKILAEREAKVAAAKAAAAAKKASGTPTEFAASKPSGTPTEVAASKPSGTPTEFAASKPSGTPTQVAAATPLEKTRAAVEAARKALAEAANDDDKAKAQAKLAKLEAVLKKLEGAQ